jgi:hypothetical protein
MGSCRAIQCDVLFRCSGEFHETCLITDLLDYALLLFKFAQLCKLEALRQVSLGDCY